MKNWFSIALLICAFTLQANVVERYYFSSAGSASLRSDAPLELITATSTQVTGIIDPVKRVFAFKIPVGSFTGFNSSTQRGQFNEKFMESYKYPDAVFTGKLPYDFSELKKGMQTLKVFGVLKIHGVQKERTIPVNLFMADQLLVVQSTFSVPLEDHNIEVPKVLFKKVASVIKIEVKTMMRIKFGAVDQAIATIN
jgi:polyisoprenoid-binding protein YceI